MFGEPTHLRALRFCLELCERQTAELRLHSWPPALRVNASGWANVRAAENNRVRGNCCRAAVSGQPRGVDSVTRGMDRRQEPCFDVGSSPLPPHLDDHSFENAGGQDPAQSESHAGVVADNVAKLGAWRFKYSGDYVGDQLRVRAIFCALFNAVCATPVRGRRWPRSDPEGRLSILHCASRCRWRMSPVPREPPGCRAASFRSATSPSSPQARTSKPHNC